MQAVSITGFKNSGKTTLILHLAEALERMGKSVAIVKRSHHTLDKPTTDTGRSRKPGRTIVALGEQESALFWGNERPLHQLLSMVQSDVLLVEGGKSRYWLPRVLCLHDVSEAEALHKGLAIASYGAVPASCLPHFTLESIQSLAELVLEKGFMLPDLNCGACGQESCHGLAQNIVAGAAVIDDCVALQADVQVQINGQPVGINPFTARIFGGAVRGMLRELKGVSTGKVQVTLTL